jgi:PST family polysaccharide transporter
MGGALSIVSIVVGLPWGATGVAASYAVTDLFLATPLLFWYVGRKGPVRAADFYRTIAPATCASVFALVLLFSARQWLEGFSHLATRLSIAFVITIVASVTVLAALPAGRLALRSLKDTLLLVLKRERASVV